VRLPLTDHSTSLHDRVVVVTGASSGIGRAVAHRAADQGARLVLVARGRSSLEEAATECRDRGAATVTVHPVDVGDDDAVRRLVAAVVGEHGRIDAVVHAAGVVAYGRAESVPAELFDGLLRTNLLGSANVARHVLPVLRGQGEGDLQLVGSIVGHITVPGMSAYAISKWGIRALAQHLRIENRDRPGVRIGYIAPGGVDTPIYTQAATVSGWLGRPPPPVMTPERAAATTLGRLGRRNPRAQLSAFNDVIRFLHVALPGVYGVLVGPLVDLLAVDLTDRVPPTSGNVLESRPDGNALQGERPGIVAGLLHNLTAKLKDGRSAHR
jgi:NAD(P)-dependent dehydrogenase (short-subunit alcohol dehydrogenase family)